MARRILLHWLLVIGLLVGLLPGPAFAEEPPSAPADKAAPASADADDAGDAASEEEYYELYKMLADAMDQVERNYVKKISRRELIEAALEGVIQKLDPYSTYIKPEELSSFRQSVDAQFGGIGIQITVDGGRLKVISPLIGTPAYRAGIRAGDWITKIDDTPTQGMTLDEAVRRLKGKSDTSVTLTVLHVENAQSETVTLTREVIQVPTVLGDRRSADDSWDFLLDHDKKIGYVRLTVFSRDTARDLRHALDLLKKEHLRGLILDLRFNPGGLLSSAIEISDLFIREGRIVSTEGRNTKKRVWNAHKDGTYEGFPIAVLVNRYSASASEITSACLQDHDRAVVIGERTWGKGSVQNVIELEGGRSALKLTTASYQRPSGKNIHRFPGAKESDAWGVMPNDGYQIKLPETELAELVRYRRDRDIIAAHQPDLAPLPEVGAPPEPAGEPGDEADGGFVDRQLQKAVEYLTQELARAS